MQQNRFALLALLVSAVVAPTTARADELPYRILGRIEEDGHPFLRVRILRDMRMRTLVARANLFRTDDQSLVTGADVATANEERNISRPWDARSIRYVCDAAPGYRRHDSRDTAFIQTCPGRHHFGLVPHTIVRVPLPESPTVATGPPPVQGLDPSEASALVASLEADKARLQRSEALLVSQRTAAVDQARSWQRLHERRMRDMRLLVTTALGVTIFFIVVLIIGTWLFRQRVKGFNRQINEADLEISRLRNDPTPTPTPNKPVYSTGKVQEMMDKLKAEHAAALAGLRLAHENQVNNLNNDVRTRDAALGEVESLSEKRRKKIVKLEEQLAAAAGGEIEAQRIELATKRERIEALEESLEQQARTNNVLRRELHGARDDADLLRQLRELARSRGYEQLDLATFQFLITRGAEAATRESAMGALLFGHRERLTMANELLRLAADFFRVRVSATAAIMFSKPELLEDQDVHQALLYLDDEAAGLRHLIEEFKKGEAQEAVSLPVPPPAPAKLESVADAGEVTVVKKMPISDGETTDSEILSDLDRLSHRTMRKQTRGWEQTEEDDGRTTSAPPPRYEEQVHDSRPDVRLSEPAFQPPRTKTQPPPPPISGVRDRPSAVPPGTRPASGTPTPFFPPDPEKDSDDDAGGKAG